MTKKVVVISNFKKAGWSEVELHPETSRKRLYKLKSPEQIVFEIAKEGKIITKLSKILY